MTAAVLLQASARVQIAGFLNALITVYWIIIFLYILSTLAFSFGWRMPYARWSSALLGFLRDVCEPYLGLFRRFIPPIGPIDISALVAILVLVIGGGLIVNLVHG